MEADPSIYVGVRNLTNYTLRRWFCRKCAEQLAEGLARYSEKVPA
jgi:hypothetical protein